MKELITLEKMRARGTDDWRKPCYTYQHALINNILEAAARIVGVELSIADTDVDIERSHISREGTVLINYMYKGKDICTVELMRIAACEWTVSRKAILEEAIQDCCIFLMKQKVKDEATMLNELT